MPTKSMEELLNELFSYNPRPPKPVKFFHGEPYSIEVKNGDKVLFTYDDPVVTSIPTTSSEVVTVSAPAEKEKENVNMNIESTVMALQNAVLDAVIKENTNTILEKTVPEIEKRITEIFGFMPQRHEIKVPGKQVVELKEVLHEKFDEVLSIVNMDIPVYLTGKAGTGKNVICKQVAEALGLDFYFTNAVTQEYKLTGFIDANGHYQETQFFKAFTRGGVFFLDEMDASIPEVLVILNAAIANRYFDFPIGKIEAHPDFRVIAAGNTSGLGADINYTGRYCLDRASLDRFAMVNIDYSDAIETSMSCGKKDLVAFAHAFRAATEEAGVECLFSYRTIQRVAILEDVLPNLTEVLTISLIKGLPTDDLKTICKELPDSIRRDNKYAKALTALTF